jgi:hypothetical protein
MSMNYTPLVEKLSRIVRDRGDVEILMQLDRLMDFETEIEQTAAFSAVVKQIGQRKSGASGGDTNASGKDK